MEPSPLETSWSCNVCGRAIQAIAKFCPGCGGTVALENHPIDGNSETLRLDPLSTACTPSGLYITAGPIEESVMRVTLRGQSGEAEYRPMRVGSVVQYPDYEVESSPQFVVTLAKMIGLSSDRCEAAEFLVVPQVVQSQRRVLPRKFGTEGPPSLPGAAAAPPAGNRANGCLLVAFIFVACLILVGILSSLAVSVHR